MLGNLRKVFSRSESVVAFFIAAFFIGCIFWYFSNFALTQGNLGMSYAVFEFTLEILVTLFFSLFIAVTVYKIVYFSHFSKRHSGAGFIAGFLGTLVVGCPACSISFATYIGLTGFLGIIPGAGVGLKIISIILLTFTDIYLLRNLELCSIKK